jgi:hypothetical protein
MSARVVELLGSKPTGFVHTPVMAVGNPTGASSLQVGILWQNLHVAYILRRARMSLAKEPVE